MANKPTLRQYAALPIDLRSGRLEIVLVTSRTSGRWIVPKGRPEARMRGHEVAQMEAFEEAGLLGTVSPKPIGSFGAEKGEGLNFTLARVALYPFRVEGDAPDFPEKGQREIRRASLLEALMLLSDGGLISILVRNEHRLIDLLPPPSARLAPKG